MLSLGLGLETLVADGRARHELRLARRASVLLNHDLKINLNDIAGDLVE